MSELLVNLSFLVLPFITLFAIFGVLCAIWAIRGVWCDEQKLLKCKKEMVFSSKDKKFASRIQKLDDYIQKLRNKQGMARVGQGKLLQLRMETIKDALEAQSAKVMPSLHDLHSLSLQDEMSRFSSCWLRTVTSFLLILGILGTLTGVHYVVGGKDGMIDMIALANALKPSMFAVFFTVVLMWLRGWYVAKLDSYLEKLDRFTMTDLIPFLQPVSQVHIQSSDLRDNLNDLKKKVEELEGLNSQMSQLHDSMEKYVQHAEKDAAAIADQKEKLDLVSNQLSQVLKKADIREREIIPLADSEESLKAFFAEGVRRITEYVQGVEARYPSVAAQYKQLTTNIDTVVQDVREGREVVGEMVDKAHNMNEMGKLVSAYEDALTSMTNKMEQVTATFTEVQLLREKVEASENLVNDSSVQAATMLAESEAILQGIKDSNMAFDQTVDDGKRDVLYAMQVLEEKVADLNKVQKALVEAWNQSAKERFL